MDYFGSLKCDSDWALNIQSLRLSCSDFLLLLFVLIFSAFSEVSERRRRVALEGFSSWNLTFQHTWDSVRSQPFAQLWQKQPDSYYNFQQSTSSSRREIVSGNLVPFSFKH